MPDIWYKYNVSICYLIHGQWGCRYQRRGRCFLGKACCSRAGGGLSGVRTAPQGSGSWGDAPQESDKQCSVIYLKSIGFSQSQPGFHSEAFRISETRGLNYSDGNRRSLGNPPKMAPKPKPSILLMTRKLWANGFCKRLHSNNSHFMDFGAKIVKWVCPPGNSWN